MEFERTIIDRAMNEGADYCDLRIGEVISTVLEVKDAELKKAVNGREKGAAVRVLFEGAWGFAATNEFTPANLTHALEAALKLARASSKVQNEPIVIASAPAFKDSVAWQPRDSPLDHSMAEKNEFILELERAAKIHESIVSIETGYSDSITTTEFYNSEGTELRTLVPRIVAQANLIARENEKIVGYRLRIGGVGGYELLSGVDINEKAREAVEAALRILHARAAKGGRMPVIADPELTGVFAHEAVGHATEADFIVSGESCLAGRLNEMIGNELITIIDDPTVEGGFGSFPYDDEGIRGQRKVLIEHGMLKTYILNRETAAKLGLDPNGGARAESFAVRPLVRMSNTFVEPGDWSFEELLEGIDYGVYAKGTRGGQVDTAKGAFQFNAQEAFLIENGEIKKPLRDISLSGDILETLHHIDALGNTRHFGQPGFCGKGQLVPVSDGGPFIRIRNAIVGGQE